jgi:hypothetical protein
MNMNKRSFGAILSIIGFSGLLVEFTIFMLAFSSNRLYQNIFILGMLITMAVAISGVSLLFYPYICPGVQYEMI